MLPEVVRLQFPLIYIHCMCVNSVFAPYRNIYTRLLGHNNITYVCFWCTGIFSVFVGIWVVHWVKQKHNICYVHCALGAQRIFMCFRYMFWCCRSIPYPHLSIHCVYIQHGTWVRFGWCTWFFVSTKYVILLLFANIICYSMEPPPPPFLKKLWNVAEWMA